MICCVNRNINIIFPPLVLNLCLSPLFPLRLKFPETVMEESEKMINESNSDPLSISLILRVCPFWLTCTGVMATVVKCDPGRCLGDRVAFTSLRDCLFLYVLSVWYVCVCVCVCVHAVTVGVSPMLHHLQQGSHYCQWESREERCSREMGE